VERLRTAFDEALRSDLLASRLGTLGVTANGGNGAAFGAMLQADLARWQAVAAPLDIQLD
jgi:tripartite-type tricarboxylate transporter receptor subunit TctC